MSHRVKLFQYLKVKILSSKLLLQHILMAWGANVVSEGACVNEGS